MCGVVGIYSHKLESFESIDAIKLTLTRMKATVASRGPDASGLKVSAPIAFGHHRLSVLELSDAGAQPMSLNNDDLIIIHNGEIYNHIELRRTLDTVERVQWRGNSDTEVILQLYSIWGMDGLKKLEGIFAFAIWDRTRRRLILMRDRLGVKPLFYGDSSHGLAFGSEIKAVIAAGGIDTELDDQSLSEYLWYGNTHDNRTFYKGVRQLEPGHWLVVEDGVRRLESWWHIEEWLERPTPARDKQEAAYLVREALDEATARQLVADVPVGIFLSGGLDSSSVAAAAMQHQPDPLDSYAAGFDFDEGVNELPKAAKVAQHLKLNHHELKISGEGLQNVLIELAKAHDEPFADAANIPLYLMCQRLAGKTKVILQGDGGDELFAGYRRYSLLRNDIWWKLWPKFLSPIARSSGYIGRRFSRIAEALGNTNASLRMAFLLTSETEHLAPERVFIKERQEDLSKKTNPFLVYQKASERFSGYEPVNRMLLTDLTVQLPSQFLVKVDRASMATGIEARVPILDEKLAMLAVNLPSAWKVSRTRNKLVLRESQRGRLPKEILNGPKIGFGVPYGNWVRTSLHDFTREQILEPSFVRRFNLDLGSASSIIERHQLGHAEHGFLIWKLLQLALWHNVSSL